MSFSTRNQLLTVLGVLFVFYCRFQARLLIFGPRVSIITPMDGMVVHEPRLTVNGRAENVAWISLNDRQIFTSEEGFWSEKMILAEGESIITVRVSDSFGREKTKSVHVVLN